MLPFSFRSLTATYALALVIIAALTISSHFVLSTTLRDTEGTAAAVNLSGRQRMLSQRIASLAAQRALGDETVSVDLEAAVDLFEAAHVRLSQPYRMDGREPTLHRLHALYFEGGSSLDAMVTGFVATARRLGQIGMGDAATPGLLKSLFADARPPAFSSGRASGGSRSWNSCSRLSWASCWQRFCWKPW